MLNLHPKVQSAGLASGIVTLLVWALQSFANIQISAAEASALTTVIGAATGYATDSGDS